MNQLKYTSFWNRLLAGIVDGLVFIPFGIIQFQFIDFDTSPTSLFALSAVNSIIFYAYSILMHHKFGQTLGKMATSIKVIDAGEESMNISLKQAILRDSIPLAFEMILITIALISILNTNNVSNHYLEYPEFIWFLIEIVTMMTNKKRRAAHDFLAKTVVIKI